MSRSTGGEIILFTVSLLLTVLFNLSHAKAKQVVTENQFRVHGLSAFKDDKSAMLQTWLTKGVNSTRATLGIYPTPLELHLYPKKSNQPVPWAHTVRDEKGSVHFYVDSRFKLQKFVDDWTIYHELAHMALPYLGSDYRWLSEGFASYMQYQIMVKAGVLKGTLKENYQAKISPQLRWFNKSELTAASIAKRLMDKRQYPAAYWGGAYFFVLADQQLQEQHKISLTELITQYQDCCREKEPNLKSVVTSLDGIIDDSIFNDLLKRYETEPARNLYPLELKLD
ncbi:hypothetical protein L0668_16105 [Paraglaciecola aquimarina]|uniref:Peptidase M61 catalytic domain-containing protein n=1 Tax=Paraglaciecola algarum TaxID=3050085 RepID=A0ABS9DDE0_9ALTE|nr:hypothetical protein [Paraglaciecola sp. G1-23]MCF2949646.1 hypothetical protein [Paraglaciecola sp. G1-23]